MKILTRLALAVLILGAIAAPAVAQVATLTTAQKILLHVTGMDQFTNATALPAGTVVTWKLYLPNTTTEAPEYADLVVQPETDSQVGGWWFVPKGKMGVVTVVAEATLPGATVAIRSPGVNISIQGGIITQIVIGFSGVPIPK